MSVLMRGTRSENYMDLACYSMCVLFRLANTYLNEAVIFYGINSLNLLKGDKGSQHDIPEFR